MTGSEVIVIGDVMLDVFESGTVSRVSPEAPVMVVLNPRATRLLGGAANTAANVERLGIHAGVVGLIGDDDAGRTCGALMGELGLRDRVIARDDVVTTVKTRYLASGQQIVRIDHEAPAPEAASGAVADAAASFDATTSAVVLSDYDKGVITRQVSEAAIARAAHLGVPVVVDSKKLSVDLFHGCTVIAPNHLEAARMTGQTNPSDAARIIAERTRSAVLVTLGPDGMLLLQNGEETRIPSHAREVSDVTGAGDTVTAGLAVALASGRSMLDAARWANMAAAVSVAHHGTYAVSAAEVESYRSTVLRS